jgi:hypothetical protein
LCAALFDRRDHPPRAALFDRRSHLGAAEVITAYDWKFQPQLVVVPDAVAGSAPARPD